MWLWHLYCDLHFFCAAVCLGQDSLARDFLFFFTQTVASLVLKLFRSTVTQAHFNTGAKCTLQPHFKFLQLSFNFLAQTTALSSTHNHCHGFPGHPNDLSKEESIQAACCVKGGYQQKHRFFKQSLVVVLLFFEEKQIQSKKLILTPLKDLTTVTNKTTSYAVHESQGEQHSHWNRFWQLISFRYHSYQMTFNKQINIKSS